MSDRDEKFTRDLMQDWWGGGGDETKQCQGHLRTSEMTQEQRKASWGQVTKGVERVRPG